MVRTGEPWRSRERPDSANPAISMTSTTTGQAMSRCVLSLRERANLRFVEILP